MTVKKRSSFCMCFPSDIPLPGSVIKVAPSNRQVEIPKHGNAGVNLKSGDTWKYTQIRI